MTDLIMEYLASPGMIRPPIEALFTNQFTGNIRLDETQWTEVRTRVSAYDKVFG
jgi:hypothetical protein